METNDKGLACRRFQVIALAVLLVAGVTTSAMAAGDFAQAGRIYDAPASEGSAGTVGTGSDATAISSNEAQPADA
jgi:hypothetical protein